MRLIFMTFFVTIILSAALTQEQQHKTVNELYQEFTEVFPEVELFSSMPIFQKIKTINRDCIKKRLKISENGQKRFQTYSFAAAFISTLAICSGDVHEFVYLLVNTMTDLLTSPGAINRIDCFKLALQELEPNAKILEGFDKNSVTTNDEDCEIITDKKGFENYLIPNIESDIGSTINEGSCGLIKKETLFQFMLKFPILGAGKLNEELEKAAKIIIVDELVGITEKLEKCLVDKMSEVKQN
ncbi:hypothetical protein PVAND_014613 [Polypedilum vanderplanki]|uniref:Uncharacterized protein n=1 Tax=Polypedilum vanderplanki TaxID=319348 RepID=A0A9J6BAP9_POLVA|nr:hypothetical protein PVAND_014613 [Polypedilum vanderplanki]